MKARPQVSVILSTFNPDETRLALAIDSICAQTLSSWEFLIYDDGSGPDKSRMIERLSGKDPRIRYIRGEYNKGIAAGLNVCIRMAKGRYLARMDDDDLSLPDRLSLQVKALNEHPEYDWVGTLADLFDEDGIWGRADRVKDPQKRDFLHSSPFIHPSVMFRREIFRKAGGYKASRCTARCEDYELFMRFYAKGFRGFNIQKPLLQYRDDRKKLRRSWKYSIYESVVRLQGFLKLEILNPVTAPFVLKPIAVRIAAFFPGAAQRLRLKGKRGDHLVSGQYE